MGIELKIIYIPLKRIVPYCWFFHPDFIGMTGGPMTKNACLRLNGGTDGT